jgi:tRNA U34 5-carboxymethylaminomethyl modifying GTPase MnmE/TrmE
LAGIRPSKEKSCEKIGIEKNNLKIERCQTRISNLSKIEN